MALSLYQQAKAIFAEHGRVSICLLQRKLRCGYGDAGRVVARMVAEGATQDFDGRVEPMKGVK